MKSNPVILVVLLLSLLAGCTTVGPKPDKIAESHLMLGTSYLQSNNPTAALKEFLQAEEVKPDDVEIQAGLAQAYQRKKAYPEAEKHYLKALKLSPDDPDVANNLGALYLDMGRWDDAKRYFRQAADNLLFAHPEVALAGEGTALLQQGNYLEAVTVLKKSIRIQPHYAVAHLRLGEVYYALDKNDQAIEEFKAALVDAPNFVMAHYKLALALQKDDRNDEAIAELNKVLSIAPDSDLAKLAKEHLDLLR